MKKIVSLTALVLILVCGFNLKANAQLSASITLGDNPGFYNLTINDRTYSVSISESGELTVVGGPFPVTVVPTPSPTPLELLMPVAVDELTPAEEAQIVSFKARFKNADEAERKRILAEIRTAIITANERNNHVFAQQLRDQLRNLETYIEFLEYWKEEMKRLPLLPPPVIN